MDALAGYESDSNEKKCADVNYDDVNMEMSDDEPEAEMFGSREEYESYKRHFAAKAGESLNEYGTVSKSEPGESDGPDQTRGAPGRADDARQVRARKASNDSSTTDGKSGEGTIPDGDGRDGTRGGRERDDQDRGRDEKSDRHGDRNRRRERRRSRSSDHRDSRSSEHRDHKGSENRDSRSSERKDSRRSDGRKSEDRRRRRSRSRDRRRSRSRSRDRRRSRSRDRVRRRSRSRERYSHSSRRSPTAFNDWRDRKTKKLSAMGIDSTTVNQNLATNMEQQLAKVKEVTGVELPKYYNPTQINPMKFAEQIKKRQMLWKKSSGTETVAPPAAPYPGTVQAQPSRATPGAAGGSFNQWEKSQLAGNEKFRRLMGIKGDAHPEEGGETSSQKSHQLFEDLDKQYEVARAVTHTARGVGLGFSNQVQFPKFN